MPDNVVALFLLGITAGILSGMFGIGGGVIIVPALILIMGYSLKAAAGTSLAVLVWPVSIFAVIAYYRARLINIRTAVLISVGLLIGGYFGAEIALGLPDNIMEPLYGLFLIYVGWRFVEPRKLYRQYVLKQAQANPGEAEAGAPEAAPDRAWYTTFAVGLLAGIVAGLFGIGGGLVIVPALVVILGYDQKHAVGTSLAALLPPTGLGAVISYYQDGFIHIAAAAAVAIGLVAGAFFGARIALGMSSRNVKRLYGVFLILVSFRFIFQIV
ncbi:MAG: hypothetical protein Kow0077_00010 [Anaerolineae bacterium]